MGEKNEMKENKGGSGRILRAIGRSGDLRATGAARPAS